jgi:hypothetical protein
VVQYALALSDSGPKKRQIRAQNSKDHDHDIENIVSTAQNIVNLDSTAQALGPGLSIL